VKLRYTGPLTVTFHTAGVGEVEPGAEFTVPDDLAESFTRRSDVEEVAEAVGVRPVSKRKAVVEVLLDALPEATDATVAADTETL
jgi:hypothetical protein